MQFFKNNVLFANQGILVKQGFDLVQTCMITENGNNVMKHNPNERWSIKKILKVFCESIDYLPLTVSQAIAMEINDKNIVQGCLKCCTE